MNHKTMTQTNTTVNNRSHRAQIAQDTLRVTERGQYRNRHDAQVIISTSLASAITGTIHYTGAELHKMAAQLAQAIGTSTVIEVTNESTLAAVRRLIADGHADVLCLNFASAKNPGGGFLGGAETQEENLAKSSGLYPCIAQKMGMYEANRRERFCAYLDDMIYSPKVPVFRDDDYDYLDAAVEVSIVTAPAVNHGAVARNDPDRVGELAGIMSRRIELLLALAHFHGHKVLVLGAWGCGVFGNNPAHIARWFHQALDGPYRNVFERVVFAVLDQRSNGTFAAYDVLDRRSNGTFAAFEAEFKA